MKNGYIDINLLNKCLEVSRTHQFKLYDKILAYDHRCHMWKPWFYGRIRESNHSYTEHELLNFAGGPYVTNSYVIPYEGNEQLAYQRADFDRQDIITKNMHLKHITFTGVDEFTNIDRLEEIQSKYPHAEFGILFSKKWNENGNRYPDPKILDTLQGRKLNLSMHLCGELARKTAEGNTEILDSLLGENRRLFKRCQLNLDAEKHEDSIRKLEPSSICDEVIVQMKSDVYCESFIRNFNPPANMSFLLDASGGRGIDTNITLIRKEGVKIGYAGGIGPKNAAWKLETILNGNGDGDFWIDMETKVRTKDVFDLDKVEEVLESCQKIIEDYGKRTETL